MIKITLNDKEVKAFIKKINNSKQVKSQVLSAIGEDAVSKAKKLAPAGATGQLANSFVHSTNMAGNKETVESEADYSDQAMEWGRKPGRMPPSEALERWAGRFLGDRRLAYAVAKSISKRGTKKYREKGPKLWTKLTKQVNRDIPRFLKELSKFYD